MLCPLTNTTGGSVDMQRAELTLVGAVSEMKTLKQQHIYGGQKTCFQAQGVGNWLSDCPFKVKWGENTRTRGN